MTIFDSAQNVDNNVNSLCLKIDFDVKSESQDLLFRGNEVSSNFLRKLKVSLSYLLKLIIFLSKWTANKQKMIMGDNHSNMIILP